MNNFSKLVDALSAERSLEVALAARSELVAEGKKAFPVLMNRLDDETDTHVEFLGSVSTTDPPTIGQVCFEILQMQIEGRWLKGFRQFRILDLTNISQWVKGHSSKSLTEMRQIVLTQAIQHVESHTDTDIEPEYATMLLRFLRDKKSFIDEPEYDFGKPVENPFDEF